MLKQAFRNALMAAPLRLWAIILAAPPLTGTAIWQTYIVWKGGWPAERAEQQLNIMAWTSMANWLLLGVIIVALASVKLKGTGPGGASFEIDAADDPVLSQMEPRE